MTAAADAVATSQLSKLCALEDFSEPEIRDLIRSVFAERAARHGGDFPVGAEERKLWEVAMAVRTLEVHGVLRDDAEILGIGAGKEQTVFWLTSRVRRVFATDLYLEPGAWADTAEASMLAVPEHHASGLWNPRRLVVQHMDALDLRYEDDSFDGIFSSSSIEHFGDHEAVGEAIREAYRVLKPGGVFSLSTEFRLEGASPGWPGVLMFDEGELRELVVGAAPWELDGGLDLAVSAATLATEQDFDAALARLSAGKPLEFPHIVFRKGPLLWTSVHLALRKPLQAPPLPPRPPRAFKRADVPVRAWDRDAGSSGGLLRRGKLRVWQATARAARWALADTLDGLRADVDELRKRLAAVERDASDRRDAS